MARTQRLTLGFLQFSVLLVVAFLGGIGIAHTGGYQVVSVSKENNQLSMVIEIVERNAEAYGPDIEHLAVKVSYKTNDCLHLHITDAERARWEVPSNLVPGNNSANANTASFTKFSRSENSVKSSTIQFSYTVSPFSFSATRVSDGEILFNSPASSKFIFKDQYLEISTTLPKDAALYGLGESTRSAGFRLVPNSTYTLWTADTGAATTDTNLYGAQPFYLDVRGGGRSHGVLLLNSNGMDIILEEELLTYKVIGGVLDFYIFAGPSPLSVVQQYTDVVGKPAPMPYWSLGFHQCRWGYKNVSQLQQVVASYKAAGLPLEVMWTDIDHMNVYKDFTLDPVNFPAAKMQLFINQLHKESQRFILIVDPGIRPDENYETYQHANALDIFVKGPNGKPYLGQVWPGPVHYPDFLHPRAEAFWTREIAKFHHLVPFDGLWIDMNEASNFCTGVTCSLPPSNVTCPSPDAFTECCLVCEDFPATKWDQPPYSINNAASRRKLGGKTIPPSATHYGGILEYNSHNLYGLSEAVVTNTALRTVLKKRPFVLSRSNFVGSGRVAAHWTGDNQASWNDLRYSIAGILNSGLAGIPMVGADICGFSGDTTEELCNRWIQLGAFYPFSRDHNDLVSRPQELYVWKSVIQSAKKALELRYRLLPHLYTLMFEAHTAGSPVARPLFFSFPSDTTTLTIDRQFLLGRSILVSPVLTRNSTSVKAYFPRGTWYNLFDYTKLVAASSGSYQVLDAPWDTINVHVHVGCIIPMQEFAMTTAVARKSSFTLLITFSQDVRSASGELFLDDDDHAEMQVAAGQSTFINFLAAARDKLVTVNSSVLHGEFAKEKNLKVDSLVVLVGGAATPRNLVVNGKREKMLAGVFTTGLQLSGLSLSLGKSFQVSFEI